jgi:peptide/nickel transport system substrate-binding protein
VTGSHQSPNRADPRRRAATTSALAAGFLVVIMALTVVFWSDISDELSSIVSGDEPVEVAEEIEETTETPVPEAPAANAYVEADVGFPSTLNPLLASSSSERAITRLLYRTLLSMNDSGDPVEDLAVDWSVSADGLTYFVELGDDAQWHDGEPVTVDDVLYTISLVRDADFPGDEALSQFWRAINVVRTGERSLEFTLLEPYVGFTNFLQLPILPKHHFGSVLSADIQDLPLDAQLVGSGPFQVVEIEIDSAQIRVERRDTGGAGFEELVFRYYDSRRDAVEAFREGDVDGVSYVPVDMLHSDDTLPGNAQVYGPELAGYTALYFNVRHPHFRDVNTRRAIEAAIDRGAIVETVLDNHAVSGDSPIPRMSSAYAPGEHQAHDPDEAESLLEQDGWEFDEDDEVRQRDGEYFLVPLIVNDDDPQRIAVANLIQEQLREIGISVDVQVMSSQDIERALATRQFTAVLFGWHTDNGNLDCFQMWHSSQGEGGANFTGFADAQADELLMQARRAGSIAERNQHYAGFQQVFADQVPAVVLFYPRYHFAVSYRVQGAQPVPLVSPEDRVRQFTEWFERESAAMRVGVSPSSDAEVAGQ